MGQFYSTIALAKVKRFVQVKFQKNYKDISLNCYRTLQICSRTVLEQIFRTFMNNCRTSLKNAPFNVFNISLNFSRLLLKWFNNNSRNVVMVCSRTVLELTLVCSRTDLEQTIIIFQEQL